MKYLLLIISLVVIGTLVVLGVYTDVGKGIVRGTFPADDAAAVLPVPLDEASGDAENVIFAPDVYTLAVDSIEDPILIDGETGYAAYLTRLDDGSGSQFEMWMLPSDLGDGYVSLEIGDIVQVEVNSVGERELPDFPLLFPITVTVEE